MFTLYHHGTSVCAAKVRLALVEKSISWEGRYVDIFAGEQFEPEFLKISPDGVVPILDHDGQIVRESTVINEYIDDLFPESPLRPRSFLARAAMRVWTKKVDEVLHPAVGAVTFAVSHRYRVLALPAERIRAFLESTRDPSHRERKRLWVEKGLDAPDMIDAVHAIGRAISQMGEALRNNRWLAGGAEYSLADVALTPYVNRLDMLGMSELWTGGHPQVADWFERIRNRRSFAPALYQFMSDELRTSMRARGLDAWPQVKSIFQTGAYL